MRDLGLSVRFCYNIKILWVVTLCGRVNSYRLFEDLRLSRSLLGVFAPGHGCTMLFQTFTQRYSISHQKKCFFFSETKIHTFAVLRLQKSCRGSYPFLCPYDYNSSSASGMLPLYSFLSDHSVHSQVLSEDQKLNISSDSRFGLVDKSQNVLEGGYSNSQEGGWKPGGGGVSVIHTVPRS
jgi:hypothetical protein